jgi:hypothetical protein
MFMPATALTGRSGGAPRSTTVRLMPWARSPTTQLGDLLVDPFVAQEQAESSGDLLAHYQVPLVDGNHVFIESKSGTYVSCNPPGSGQPYPCGPDSWNNQIWNEQAYVWQNGSLVQTWNFQSDWKPEPNTDVGGQNQDGLGGWEPVFHPVLWNGYLFVPGWGGTIYKVNEATGAEVAQYNPNGTTIDSNSFVSGPLTIDQDGNVYYNVLALDATNPWSVDIRNAFLVKVSTERHGFQSQLLGSGDQSAAQMFRQFSLRRAAAWSECGTRGFQRWLHHLYHQPGPFLPQLGLFDCGQFGLGTEMAELNAHSRGSQYFRMDC